jgi:threonine/homoserine/homoserine lactone efflux protein
MSELSSFVLAALALAGSPGPNTLSLAAVGAAFGRLRGMRYMAGLTLGMVFVIAIVGSGVSGVLLALPGAASVITLIAAAYFAYLAYRIATAPPLRSEVDAGAAPHWFEGTFLSLVNPKAYAAMAAMFSSFVLVSGDRISDSVTKAGVLMAVILGVNVGWLFVGAALTRVMRDARWSRLINIAFAVALVVSVVAAVLV